MMMMMRRRRRRRRRKGGRSSRAGGEERGEVRSLLAASVQVETDVLVGVVLEEVEEGLGEEGRR
jgi:hypothetical protein